MRRYPWLPTLAVLTFLAPSARGADQSTPEQVVERALDALNHDKLDVFIRSIHPDALKDLRTMVLEVMDEAAKQGKEALFVGSFPGVKDAAALRALDAPGLLTVMLNKVTADPEVKKLLATTKVDALGRITNPAKDRALVAYRTKSKFGQLDIVRVYAASLLKSGPEWKMALPDDMASRFSSMRQEMAPGDKARPDVSQTKVEPLGHVMDGKGTALVIYRTSIPVGTSAITNLAVASVDARDAAFDAATKDDIPSLTAYLERKLGIDRTPAPAPAPKAVNPAVAAKVEKARAEAKARFDEQTAQARERAKAQAEERSAAFQADSARRQADAKAKMDERTAAAEARAEARRQAPAADLATAATPRRPAAGAAEPAPDGLVDLPASFFGGDRDRFRDLAPAGGVLVGVKVSYITKMGGPKTSSVQPVYRVGEKLVDGTRRGTLLGREIKAVAKDGYAVGGLNTHTGLSVDGFELVFMKVAGDHLDPGDSYTSAWLGDTRGGSPRNVAGDGKLPVGLQGRAGKEVNALGLVVRGSAAE